MKNRRSGDFGYSLSSDAVDNTDNTDDVLTNSKVDTLDPGPEAGGIQHNLRPLLRNKYMMFPLSDTEEYLGSGWGTGSRGGGVMIKHFGMIDQPPEEEIRSHHSLQYNTRYSLVFLNPPVTLTDLLTWHFDCSWVSKYSYCFCPTILVHA
jgi:hypothetical protein